MRHGVLKGLKWLLPGLLAVLLLAAALAWWGRDWPRRWLEAEMIAATGPQASLGGIEVVDGHTVILKEIRLVRPEGFPWLQDVVVGRLTVEGTPQGLYNGYAATVTVESCRLHIDASLPIEIPETETPLRIGTLIVQRCAVDIESPAGIASVTVEGRLRDFNERLAGELFFAADDLPVGVLTAAAGVPEEWVDLDGRVRDLRADLRLEQPGERWQIELGAGAAEFATPSGRLRLERLRIEATGEDSATPGRRRVTVRPALDLFRQGRLTLELDVDSWSWSDLEARIEGLDLGRLAAAVEIAPGVLERLGVSGRDRAGFGAEFVQGEGDLELEARPGSASLQVQVRIDRWSELFGFYLAGDDGPVELQLSGEFRGAALAELSGEIDAAVDLPRGLIRIQGREIPAVLLPLTVQGGGEVSPAGLSGAHLVLTPAAFGPLQVSGGLDLAGAVPVADLEWAWGGGRISELRDLAITLGAEWPPAATAVEGALRAHGTVRGPVSGPDITAAVELRGLAASLSIETLEGPVRIQAESATIDLSAGAELKVRSVAPGLDVTLDLPGGTEPLPLHLEVAIASALDLGAGRVERLVASSPSLGEVAVSGSWLGGDPAALVASGRLVLSGLVVPAWQELLAVQLPVATENYSISGQVDADLEWTVDLRSGRWQADGKASLGAAGFSSLDGSRVLEGFDSRSLWHLEGVGSESGEAEVEADIGGFVLLLGSFFGDASHLDSHVAGRFGWPQASVGPGGWEGEATWEVADGPRLELEVSAESSESGDSGLDFRAAFSVADLGATHRRYVAPVVGEILPPLDFAGGLVATTAGRWLPDGSGDADLQFDLHGFGVRSEAPDLVIRDLDLDLPVNLRWNSDSPGLYSGESRSGRVRFAQLAASGIELPAGDLALRTEGDSLRLEEAVEFPLLGGRMALERLSLVDLLRSEPRLETGLEIQHLSMEELSSALDLLPLEGFLTASFPRVVLTPESLLVDGGGEMEVFGGRVILEEVSGSEVLSDYPTFVISTRFNDIDLGQLTQRIDFGEMSGVLEGHLRNCRLFRGVPVEFEAMVRTVKRRGVDRSVSVKAINNMAILGTGRGTGNIFDSGIRRFMNRFTYKRLGMTMRLEDDVFLLRGLEKKGDLELFVKGRLPFPINIVNAQPGQSVSFQTMLRRLQSLELGDGTAEGGRSDSP